MVVDLETVTQMSRNVLYHCAKTPWFRLISWCENFVERQSFCLALANLPETMRKQCLSTKFPHQQIRWHYGVLTQCIHCTKIYAFITGGSCFKQTLPKYPNRRLNAFYSQVLIARKSCSDKNAPENHNVKQN